MEFEDVPWELAACAGVDPDLFFPNRGDDPNDTATARATCRRCPILYPCREYAIEHEKHGIWGNTGDRERRDLRRERGITVRTPEVLTDLLPVSGRC